MSFQNLLGQVWQSAEALCLKHQLEQHTQVYAPMVKFADIFGIDIHQSDNLTEAQRNVLEIYHKFDATIVHAVYEVDCDTKDLASEYLAHMSFNEHCNIPYTSNDQWH